MEFEKINSTTERAKNIIRSYDNSCATQLWQVYPTHYSGEKARAYKECVEMMNNLGGYDLKIISYAKTNFTVGFIFTKDNKKYLAYITYKNNYKIELGKASASDKLSADEWYDDFKNRYDNLGDTTKKHLANACPHITSREQADSIMKVSQVFDLLFKMGGAK